MTAAGGGGRGPDLIAGVAQEISAGRQGQIMTLKSLLLLGATIFPLPALAGPLTDLIMAPGLFAEVPTGAVLHYAHTRRLPGLPQGATLPGAQTGVPLPDAIVDGQVLMTLTPSDTGAQIVMTQVQADQTRPIASFPAAGPNPLLIFFLENVVRNMAAQTGGSPHYMRNVIRAVLAESAPAMADAGPQTVTLRPFDGDPNAAKMGDFAGLTIAMTFDPATPGQLLDLTAQAGTGPDGYRESLTLTPED